MREKKKWYESEGEKKMQEDVLNVDEYDERDDYHNEGTEGGEGGSREERKYEKEGGKGRGGRDRGYGNKGRYEDDRDRNPYREKMEFEADDDEEEEAYYKKGKKTNGREREVNKKENLKDDKTNYPTL